MKRINLILLTLILTVVLLGVEVFIVRSASSYEPEMSVVFAKVKIPENTIVREDMLEEKKVEISLVHKLSVKRIDDISGRKARMDIEAGEMLLSSRFYTENEMEEIKVKDKRNRLFSVELKGDQANGWWLTAGQYVDILFVPNKRTGLPDERKPRDDVGTGETDVDLVQTVPVSEVQRLRNIRIAALIDDKGKLVKNRERPELPCYVCFEVTDRQDEFLAYAKGNGRLEISVIPNE